ncbi:DUF4232 domain-containing protein [Streptomyces sp. NPDC048111]|uniref:DUF4232 domain-containing protein n=1 Tax=Streptomyces sp. NPDC048111 TaxID=3365500 RepID=UPI00371FC0FE
MRVRKLTFAALAVAAGLSLTACQSDDGSTAQNDPSSASSSSASGGSGSGSGSSGAGSAGSDQGGGKDSAGKGTGGSGSAGSGTAGSGGSGGSAKGGKCRTADLKISASDSTIGGDADRSVAVEFKNVSGHDCMLSGFAGVDLKTNAGSLSAKRTGQPASLDTLKNGKSVFFNISYPANDSGGSGVRITGLLVTPPGETKTATLAWPGAATLPVTEGGGSQVKVGPIGSAGQGG